MSDTMLGSRDALFNQTDTALSSHCLESNIKQQTKSFAFIYLLQNAYTFSDVKAYTIWFEMSAPLIQV